MIGVDLIREVRDCMHPKKVVLQLGSNLPGRCKSTDMQTKADSQQ